MGDPSEDKGYPPMGQESRLPQRPGHSQKPNGSRPKDSPARHSHSKRLTLSFPVNLENIPSDLESTTSESMTPVSHRSIHQSPGLPANLGTPLSFEERDDGTDLLRAIASQERKVLELREELQNAEAELASLKRQWASSESLRKRTEINHHAEPLLPLKSTDRPTDDSLDNVSQNIAAGANSSFISTRPSRDFDRRRTAAAAGTFVSTSGRRVFQGSHTRTLSLLSVASDSAYRKRDQDTGNGRVGRYPRAATLPSVDRSNGTTFRPTDYSRPMADGIVSQRRSPAPSRQSHETLMRTGRRMASDLREGLWTFLEDIRQATVGDEGIYGTEARGVTSSHTVAPRRKSPNPNGRLSVQEARSTRQSPSPSPSPSPSTQQDAGKQPISGKDTMSTSIGASFWNEFGIDTSGQNSSGNGSGRTRNSLINEGASSSGSIRIHAETDPEANADTDTDADNWDWDSATPQPRTTTATTTTVANNTHSPSSSRSTLESKPQSPRTQNSSPRTSASFGDWSPALGIMTDPSISDGIPWPAITKPFPVSKLTRTASNLMDEWERSLSPVPSPSLSSLSPPLLLPSPSPVHQPDSWGGRVNPSRTQQARKGGKGD